MHKFVCKIFPECSLVVEFMEGNISWYDVIKMKQNEVKESGYNPHFNLITDARNIRLLVNDLEGIKKYMEYLKGNQCVLGSRKTAIITSSSQQVIHSELLKLEARGLPMYLKTVSTYEAAFEWTKLDNAYQSDVINYIESLRKPFLEASASA